MQGLTAFLVVLQTLASCPSRKGGPLKFIAPIVEDPEPEDEDDEVEGSAQQARKTHTALCLLTVKGDECLVVKAFWSPADLCRY